MNQLKRAELILAFLYFLIRSFETIKCQITCICDDKQQRRRIFKEKKDIKNK